MKDLNYYLSLPYTTILKRDEEGDIVARIDELKGCSAHGKTELEAIQNLEQVKRLWIEESLAARLEIPEPELATTLPSGKWVQRVARSLHKKLVALAKKEDVSLNQLVATVLAEAVGERSASEKRAHAEMATTIATDWRWAELRAAKEDWSVQNVTARTVSVVYVGTEEENPLNNLKNLVPGLSGQTETPLKKVIKDAAKKEKDSHYIQ